MKSIQKLLRRRPEATRHCLSVVSNKQGWVTYTRTLSINNASHGPSVVSNEQGYIGFWNIGSFQW